MKNCCWGSQFPDHPSWHFPSDHIFSVWGHMSSYIPNRPHSAHSSTGDRAPVRSYQLCLSLIAASLIACSDSLRSFSALWKQLSSANQVARMFKRETRGHCDSAVGENRGGGLFNRQFEPFCVSAPAACLNLQQFLIGGISSSSAVLSVTAIFNISLVRVAQLLHISLGKCTYGWAHFRWCH